MAVMNIETESGYKLTVDEEALNDIQLIDDLKDLDAGNMLALSSASERLLGREQREELYKQIKEKTGSQRVKVNDFKDALSEIITAIGKSSEKVKK